MKPATLNLKPAFSNLPDESDQSPGVPLEPLWYARLAIVVIIVLQIALSQRFTLGPNWLLPMLEMLMLIPLAFTPRDHVIGKHRSMRVVAIALIALTNVSNMISLVILVRSLLHGNKAGGTTLLLEALNIWFTNMIIFALWYWELDQGGPHERGQVGCEAPDFLFTQMGSPQFAKPGWRSGFMDYLFLSFTNATAFSPTDTLPLSSWAKLLMMVQSGTSLLTVALVASRAVNILT